MDLALDPVSVNTELAEKYLKAHNNFSLWPAPDKLWHVKEYHNDKVEYSIGTQLNEIAIEIELKPYAIKKLIEKIQENTSLFCQLEYATRKIDEEDVKKNLLLICQYLQCDEYSWIPGNDKSLCILVKKTTPLYILGSIAALKGPIDRVAIIASQEAAAICHLFTGLCAQAGLYIPLIFTSDMEKTTEYATRRFLDFTVDFAGSVFECTGVVTESADMDSALDVFINSTLTAPWKIQSILVQESVYDEVKEALAARCDRVPSQGGLMFSGGGKVFVCDALDSGAGAGGGARVPLEAYRTSRELCALLRQKPARALTLWAADSQLAHEVALAAPATLVWINEYASFHGPPESALPLYEPLYNFLIHHMNKTEVENLESSWIAWNKLTKKERVKLILEHLEALKDDPDVAPLVDKVQNYVMDVRDHSFVTVECGKICFGVERSKAFEDIVYCDESDESSLKCSINAVVNGATLLFPGLRKKQALKAFENAGAPVLRYAHSNPPLSELKQNFISKKLKVVRSNFGTIFAN